MADVLPHALETLAATETDPGSASANAIIKADLGLYELSRNRVSLEDVFINLTTEEPSVAPTDPHATDLQDTEVPSTEASAPEAESPDTQPTAHPPTDTSPTDTSPTDTSADSDE
mgnify:CR=1 FL=1